MIDKTFWIFMLALTSVAGAQAPAVVDVLRRDTDPTTASRLGFMAEFDEPVTGVDTADFAVAGTSSGATVAGLADGALDLPGGGRVVAADVAGFPSSAFTIEFRVRTTDNTGALLDYAVSGANSDEVRVGGPGNLHLRVDEVQATSTIAVMDGVWHHVAITWESATGDTRFYLDGVLDTATTLQAGVVLDPMGTLSLAQDQGAPGTNYSSNFGGDFDEVRIWSVVRTPAEIAADMSRPLIGTEANLALYWPLDELEELGVDDVNADDVRDRSANGNHGDAQGTQGTLVAGAPMDGTRWAVTVDSLLACTGTIGLDVLDDGSITATASGTPLAGPFAGGEVYTFGLLASIIVPIHAPTIQAALDLVCEGGVVELWPGTYFEHGLDFHGRNATLRGIAGAEVTIIDGESLGTVLHFLSGEGPGAVLEDLTIRNGRAPNGTGRAGGGIRIIGASPTLRRCIVADNRAGNGLGNSTGGDGGGIKVTNGGLLMEDCLIRDNTAGSGGGNITGGSWGGDGGGVQVKTGTATFRRCRFEGNRAGTAGDGTFGSARGGAGGGLACEDAVVLVESCVFHGNRAGNGNDFSDGGNGGGLAARGTADVDIEHSTFRDNRRGNAGLASSAGNVGAIWVQSGAATDVRNSIVWANTGATEISGTATVTWSDVQGGFPGAGNIDLAPSFVDAAGGDLRLTFGSPCRDAGEESGIAATDIDGGRRSCWMGTDMGAHEYCYPGSGEDFVVDVRATGGFAAGNLMEISLETPGGTFAGAPLALLAQFFAPGFPPTAPPPFQTELYIAPAAVPGPVVLLGAGGAFGAPVLGLTPTSLHFTIPAGLTGADVMIQGLALTFGPPAANGFFATTDGEHVTFE